MSQTEDANQNAESNLGFFNELKMESKPKDVYLSDWAFFISLDRITEF